MKPLLSALVLFVVSRSGAAVAFAAPDLQSVIALSNPVIGQIHAPNVFALARNRKLSASEIDGFVDGSVIGGDRQLADCARISV
jgi:hypothetical protein